LLEMTASTSLQRFSAVVSPWS